MKGIAWAVSIDHHIASRAVRASLTCRSAVPVQQLQAACTLFPSVIAADQANTKAFERDPVTTQRPPNAFKRTKAIGRVSMLAIQKSGETARNFVILVKFNNIVSYSSVNRGI